MSYCRLSSDDFQSDVYVYATVNGRIHIHMAIQKRKINPKLLPPKIEEPDANLVSDEEWDEITQQIDDRNAVVMELLESIPYEKLNGPFAGKTFVENSKLAAYNRLLEIRNAGYHVPQHALDRLFGEMNG